MISQKILVVSLLLGSCLLSKECSDTELLMGTCDPKSSELSTNYVSHANVPALFDAVEKRDFESIKRIILSGTSPNERDPRKPEVRKIDTSQTVSITTSGGSVSKVFYSKSNQTPLYSLVSWLAKGEPKELEIAKFLLDHGANPNAAWTVNNDQTSPLSEAVQSYNSSLENGKNREADYFSKIIRLLLEKGGNPNLQGYLGSPFEMLVRKILDSIYYNKSTDEHLEVAIEMIKHGADSSYLIQELLKSDKPESLTLLTKLSEKGVKFEDASSFYFLVDDNENGKNNKKIELFLKNGFDVNRPYEGEPLIRRLQHNKHAVTMMLKFGARFEDMDEHAQQEYKKLNPNASTADKINWLMDDLKGFLFSMNGILVFFILIVASFAAFRVKIWKKEQLREKRKASVSKSRMDIEHLRSKILALDLDFLPTEKADANKTIEGLDHLEIELATFNGKEEEFEPKEFSKKLQTIESNINTLANESSKKIEEIANYRSIISDAKIQLENLDRTVNEINAKLLGLEELWGIKEFASQSSDLKQKIQQLQYKCASASSSLDLMKSFAENMPDISSLTDTVSILLDKWNIYHSEFETVFTAYNHAISLQKLAETLKSNCQSVADESAAPIEAKSSELLNAINVSLDILRSKDAQNKVEEVVRLCHATNSTLTDIELEFAAKFKTLAEFKKLPNDTSKKEWILANGYISWFFNDPKIAEKFKEFDPLEEKFKYLLQASEKLRFLDLDPREEKTTWPVFMQEISSDMSYSELSEFMKRWQTSEQFKQRKENWQKKLNESKTEEKKLLQITSKFVNIRF